MNASMVARKATIATTWTLANGARIPKIGFGTWKMSREQAGPSVSHALKTGFRQIDSAWAYRNEDATGEAIRKSGIDRKDLWITSKLWNTFHGDKVELGLDATLKDLGVDYLDLYLMHWPVAFANPNSSQVSSIKSMGGKPVEDAKLSHDLAATWLKMEEMVRKGKVRNIGVSNFNIRRTEQLLLASTETNPVINQVEVNFGVPNEELLHYSEAHQIMLQAYSPLGGPNYHEKYLYDPIINDVANRNNMTPAQVMLAWPIARGIIPLTKSVNPSRIEENFASSQMKLDWDDVIHLNNEAQARPIDRSMDPTETWAPEEDIFEDYKDQTLLNSLKGDAFHAPKPHETDGSHYLEPRNDPAAPKLGPGGTAIREMHTMAARGTSSRRPTTLQQMMKGRRAFSSTTDRSASTTSRETAAPSLDQAPGVSTSSSNPLLGKSAKSATLTPGIQWTDGEAGLERQVRKMNMYTAIRDAQSHALASDDTALVFGEDVSFGGVFRSTMGLSEEFGRERVFNTPLTEQGIVGFGIGIASMGHTAIAEIQFADYIFPAFDQLINEAAKYRYRSGNQHNAGKLTIRSPCMGVGHGALYHSQSVEQFFMPAAGLKVVIPRSPIQAKGLLLASIRDDNPVIFLEPKVLYRSSVEYVPVDDYTLPLSQAEVLQSGDTITLLSWGAPLYSCVEAINMLRNPPVSISVQVPQGIRSANVELIDLRTILPWDRETIAKSVAKTGRCVIVHEAPVTAGAGAEIAASLQQSCFLNLEAPICRIGGFDTAFPHVHETWYKPGPIQILDGLIQTLTY